MSRNTISWIAHIIIVIILTPPTFFKLTGDAMPVVMFEQLSIEPFGRIGVGIIELLAVMLLLIPRTKAIGALLALGNLAGAVIAHLTILGIEIGGDASLFGIAIAGFTVSLFLVFFYKDALPIIGNNI